MLTTWYVEPLRSAAVTRSSIQAPTPPLGDDTSRMVSEPTVLSTARLIVATVAAISAKGLSSIPACGSVQTIVTPLLPTSVAPLGILSDESQVQVPGSNSTRPL